MSGWSSPKNLVDDGRNRPECLTRRLQSTSCEPQCRMSYLLSRLAGFSPGQAVQQMVAPTPEAAEDTPVHAPEAQGQSVPRGPLT